VTIGAWFSPPVVVDDEPPDDEVSAAVSEPEQPQTKSPRLTGTMNFHAFAMRRIMLSEPVWFHGAPGPG
jgi:hypothetical protein